jgi:multimeric flavodoxin WrbA
MSEGRESATLLIVHHTPSPATAELFDAVLRGAQHPEITGVEVVRRAALAATASDVLAADGLLLGTPANIGYMSGALKHFFDQIYYPVLDDTKGRPYGLYVHGNQGTEGAVKAVESIAEALRWQAVGAPVTVTGTPTKADLEACWELGATVAATLMG